MFQNEWCHWWDRKSVAPGCWVQNGLRSGWVIIWLCLQAKYTSTLFLSFWAWVLFIAILCTLFKWSTGWKLERTDQPKLLPWVVFSGTILLLCLLLFPLLISGLFSDWSTTMYRLFLQNCTVSGFCPLLWMLLIIPSQVLCFTPLTAEFPPLPSPSTFIQFSRWFLVLIPLSSGLAVPSSIVSQRHCKLPSFFELFSSGESHKT